MKKKKKINEPAEKPKKYLVMLLTDGELMQGMVRNEPVKMTRDEFAGWLTFFVEMTTKK